MTNMKPIDEMSDQEKSVVLARLCGWKAVYKDGKIMHSVLPKLLGIHDPDYGHWSLYFGHGEYLKDPCYTNAIFDKIWHDEFEDEQAAMNHICPNLYDPANMRLVLRVFRWALDSELSYRFESWLERRVFLDIDNHTRHAPNWWYILYNGPNEALDKIVSLAIAAGMLQDTAVSQEEGE